MSHRPNTSLTLTAALLLLAAASLCAQTPSAPIPAQLATAKSVFLANAGSTPLNNQLAVTSYNNIYQGLTAQNRYRLTSAPADADLILEVSVVGALPGVWTNQTQCVQLVIRDARSQSLLWSTSEAIAIAFKAATFEKNFADADAKLVTDLVALTAGSAVAPPPTTAPKKTRLSDEPKN